MTRIVLLLFLVSIPTAAQEWITLFDGKNLDSWDKRSELWGIEDGAIATKPSPQYARGDLISRRAFRDFELEFEWKVARGANAGIKYRLQGSYDYRPGSGPNRSASDGLLSVDWKGPKPVSVIGFEYQLADDATTGDVKNGLQFSAGALYHYAAPKKTRSATGEVWHKGRIVVRGMHVEHWLNGEKVIDVNLDAPGLIWSKPGNDRAVMTSMLLAHRNVETPIALQYHNSKAWYRNIRIRPR
jgi:hypothetical protein